MAGKKNLILFLSIFKHTNKYLVNKSHLISTLKKMRSVSIALEKGTGEVTIRASSLFKYTQQSPQ